MKNVLLISALSEEYYYKPFVTECFKRGISLHVFDPTKFPDQTKVSVALDSSGNLSGFIDTFVYLENYPTKSILSLSDIHIAWYLREGINNQFRENELLESRFSENESKGALRSVLSVLPCKWVNQKETVNFLTSNKFYQQQIAQRCGLTVPCTLISNNPDEVVHFSESKKGLLLKSIGYIKLDDSGQYFLYSQRFSHAEIIESPQAIQVCPIFCQEYVEKRFEYRVMVIGTRVLSCRIDSQASEHTKIDWRHYDFDHVEHLQVELPLLIQNKLLLFMKTIGLQYGAIDMIETPSGDFVFLEVNPSGQWGWIADIAGIPIIAAVAEMLESL